MGEKNEDFNLRKINIKMNIRHSNDNFKQEIRCNFLVQREGVAEDTNLRVIRE